MEATAPVTVEQAAAALGVSPSTVHRRIRSGVLRAERVTRPQGAVWLVHLPSGTAAATGEPPPPTTPEATAPTTVPAQAEAMVSLIQTTIGTVLGPLVGQLDAQRQTIERQADQLVRQAETIGELRAQNHALVARTAAQDEQALRGLDPPRWRVLLPWLFALLVIVAVVALLVVPR